MQNLIGLKGGQDATYFEVIDVRESQIPRYPSVVNGKELHLLDAPSVEYYFKHKRTVTVPGYVCTVAGNAVAAEDKIAQAMGDGWSSLAVGPNTVHLWRESDYQAALAKITKEEVV